ncbi:MAG: alpha/beta hydrolase [Actinomycetota bacterium]
MTRRTASTDQVDLAIHDLGGDGPPLIFVHATGFHGRCYTRVADRLADVRHCWAPDLRAHGDSTIPADDRFHWSGMADDLCAVLDELEIDQPVDFVGHSMGGATVIATELRRPGTIRTAWLFEPIVFPPMDGPPSTMSDVARKRRATFDSIDGVLERYGSRPPFSAVDPDVLDDYVRHGFESVADGVTLKCTPESEARTFESVDYEVFDRLGSIDADITVISSTDGAPPATIAPQVAAAIGSARLVVWEGETHFGPFTHPGRAADEIRAGLR